MYRLFLLSLILIAPLQATMVVIDGQPIRKEYAPTMSPQQHFNEGRTAFDKGQWGPAARHMQILAYTYPTTTLGQDAFYFLGISEFHLGEFDLANVHLTEYLNSQTNPIYFEKAVEYKFYIAEKFRGGARKRLFGTKSLPKWSSGKETALNLYDEVLAALPNHDLAVKALFYKGCLLWDKREYQSAIDAFQTVVRRFPKEELAPDSYLFINKVYLEQSEKEFHNPDLMAFAELNLNRFETAFPREEKVEEARKDLMRIKERYANGLYQTGQFYERIEQPRAAVIYYQKAYRDFPETQVGLRCKGRLQKLYPQAVNLKNPSLLEDFPETEAVEQLEEAPIGS